MQDRTGWNRAAVVGVLLAFACALPMHPAQAGGIALLESGGKRMGSGFAGGAASAEDATTIWWNPAGMTRIRRHNAVVSAHYIVPRFAFDNEGSLDVASMPLSGRDADGGVEAFVPSAYAAFRLNRQWHVGLSINTPFGLSTRYPDDWVGRYYATESEMVTFNINPAVACKINRCWSVGVGLNALYTDASLENRVDFGAFAQAPQAFDGTAKASGEDWGFGWNVGVLYEPSCCTRFGLHYRSKVDLTLEGDGEFVVPAAVAGGLPPGLFTNTGAEADVEFPDSLSFSAYHKVNNCLAVMGDVTWTHWRTFDELIVEFDNPAQPDNVLDLDWRNTFRYSLGVAWTPNDRWEFRAGVLFDPTPVPTKNRTPRIPDADRFWVTLGAGFQVNRRMRIDLSYAHIFAGDADIRQVSATAGSLFGSYDSSGDLVGLQLSIDF